MSVAKWSSTFLRNLLATPEVSPEGLLEVPWCINGPANKWITFYFVHNGHIGRIHRIIVFFSTFHLFPNIRPHQSQRGFDQRSMGESFSSPDTLRSGVPYISKFVSLVEVFSKTASILALFTENYTYIETLFQFSILQQSTLPDISRSL